MLWIWQVCSNDVSWLQDRGVKIWNEWMIDDDGIYRIYEQGSSVTEYDPDREVTVTDPLSVPISDPFGEYTAFDPKYNDAGKVMTAKSRIPGRNIKTAKWYGKEYAGTIGTAYGYITKRYDMARALINSIKNCPTARRKVFSLWQNEFLRTAVLPSCVWSTEWNVYKDTLNLEVHQRSCDVPLGLPFNVTQYATLLKMIAQVTDLEPGFVSYSINEPHIYMNQLDGIREQLRRAETYEYLNGKSELELLREERGNLLQMRYLNKESSEYKALDTDNRIIDMILNPTTPELILNKDVTDFFAFDNSKELKDIKLVKYKHMGKIPMPIAQ